MDYSQKYWGGGCLRTSGKKEKRKDTWDYWRLNDTLELRIESFNGDFEFSYVTYMT